MRKLQQHYLLLTSCLSAAVPLTAFANPEGGNVVAGSAVISSSGNQVDIHQSSQRAIIDWRSFDIAPNETTRFHQPDASSHTLNRVNSMSRSVIEGTIQANGNITIINPNGVFFSRGSTVDVGGLTATTADIRNDDFMAGRAAHTIASPNMAAEVRNEGTITVKDTGLVALVAPTVVNDGVITAKLGKVHLASGDTFVMDVGGDGHMQVAMSQATMQRQIVTNSGKISADGGYVALTAAATRDVVDSLITNTGVIEAKSVGNQQGKVVLYGEGSNAVAGNNAALKGVKQGVSTVVHAGTIDVSGKNAGERGGSVEILGDQIALANGSSIDASGHTGATGTTDGKAVSAVRTGAAGGDIKIGGDYQGQGTTAAAKKVYVDAGASIKNDATSTGDAGRTVVWSDGNTQFAGKVSATSVDGKGGFTEVSGKNALGFSGQVDLRSANGDRGTLLLDPTDITISTAADSVDMTWDGTQFGDQFNSTSNLNTTTLTNQLGLSDVLVSTISFQPGSGTIDVQSAINWNSGYSLTLLADSDITVRSDIVNSGSGAITLTANAGEIYIRNAATIDAGGGLLTLNSAGNIYYQSSNLNALSGTGITINGNNSFLNSTGAYRTLNAKTGTLTLNGTTDANAVANLNLIADGFAIGGDVSTVNRLYVNAYSNTTKSMGLAGEVGNVQLDSATLNHLNPGQRVYIGSDSLGTTFQQLMRVGTYDWGSRDVSLTAYGGLGTLGIQGAQTAKHLRMHASAFNIGGNLNTSAVGSGVLSFSGINWMSLGGAAGTTNIDSAELDRIVTGWGTVDFGAQQAGDIFLWEYNNWRTPTSFTNTGNLYVLGTQTSQSASASFNMASRGNNNNINISADINFLNGNTVTIATPNGTGNTVTLGANITAGNGLTIRRATTLSGAAGDTRTLNSGTGAFTLAATGSINAQDKNLEIIANSLSISGVMNGIAGIKLSPYSTWYTIGVGDNSGGHDVTYSTAFVNTLKTNFASYTFGRSTTGSITNYMGTWDDPVTFLSANNFTTGTAITADDDVTVTVGDDVVVGHNISSTNGPIALRAGTDGNGNININSGASIDAGAGSLTLRAENGSVNIDAFNSSLVSFVGTGLNITSQFLNFIAPPSLYAQERYQLNSKTGMMSLNTMTTVQGAGDYRTTLSLIGDNMDITDNLWFQGTGDLTIGTYTAGRQITLGGGVGGLELSNFDLGSIIMNYGSGERRIFIGTTDMPLYTANPSRTSGNIVFGGTRTWSGGQSELNFLTTGQIIVNASQNLSNTYSTIFRGDMDVNASVSNGNLVFFYGKQGALFDIGGAADTTLLDSTELDRFTNIANSYFVLTEATGMTMQAYNNWRGNNNFGYGTNGAKTLTVAGAQSVTGNSNLYFGVGGTDNKDLTINVNADISTYPGTGELYFHRASTSNMNLGANLTSMGGGISLDREVTLTGAAGTTRTINSGWGYFTINYNGTTFTGGVNAGDKNLEVISDSLAQMGDGSRLWASTGGILLSPYSGAYSIGVGSGGAENIIYSDTLIGNLKNNFAHYTFGRTGTGDITNHMAAWDDAVTFLSGTSITNAANIVADDSVTLTARQNITLNNSITATSGPVTLTAGTSGIGNIDINNGANIDAGLGALTLTATGGSITVADADLIGTNVTINSAMALDGTSGAMRLINAKSGTLTIANNGTTTFGSINVGDKTLNMVADNMTIGGTVSGTGTVGIRGYDQNRTIGLAGGAGDLQLDNGELDFLTVSNQRFGSWVGVGGAQRGITVGARTWGALDSIEFMNVGGTGFTTTGAQNFGNASVLFFGSHDFVIGDTISGTGDLNFYGYSGGIGGAAGTTKLDSVELNRLADGFNQMRFGYGAGGNITLEAYNNWRDGVYIDNVGTLTVNGAQSAATGSDAYMLLLNNGALTISNIVDMSGSTGGSIVIGDSAVNTASLGANLSSGVGGVYIGRATTLTGAAGTTRTINAGTGAFTTSATGDISAGDKNLIVIADSVALNGDLTSTSGNITLRPYTDARTVGIGTGVGDFSLDNSELALINAGSGILTLGSATGTGAYNITTNHTFDEHVVFDTDTGIMTLASNLNSNAKNMSFSTAAGNFRVSGNRAIQSTGGGNLNFTSIDGATGSEIVTVASGGALTISDASGAVNGLDELSLTSQGAMAIDDVTSGQLFARTLGATSDITLNGKLTMLNNGTALELVSGDDIINNYGAGVFDLPAMARFVTWSDDPLQDTGEEHFSGAATKRYNRNYGDTIEATGNIRNYSVNPTLTVTATGSSYHYGDAAVAPTSYTLTGWHMAEDEAVHNMSGVLDFSTDYVQGQNAGTTYNVANNGSTLASNLNYTIGYNAGSFTVAKANLRVKAVDLNYVAGSGVPVVTFLYAPGDFKMGQNAATAGLIGAPTVSNINWNTVSAGTYAMQVGLGGLSSINYSFSEFMPRGMLTVTAASSVTPTVPQQPAQNTLPSTVQQVMNNAGILYADVSQRAMSGTNNSGNTNSGKRKDGNSNAGTLTQNVNLYDVSNGQMVASMLGSIHIDPAVMQAFGLTYESKPGNDI